MEGPALAQACAEGEAPPTTCVFRKETSEQKIYAAQEIMHYNLRQYYCEV
jgi:hypothetical protein